MLVNPTKPDGNCNKKEIVSVSGDDYVLDIDHQINERTHIHKHKQASESSQMSYVTWKND